MFLRFVVGWRIPFILVCLLLFGAGPAIAHKGSDAYLDVQEVGDLASAASGPAAAERVYRFSLAVAIKDLDLLVPIDANADGKVTWGEVKAAMPLVQALANEVVNIEPQGQAQAQGQTQMPMQPQAAGQGAVSSCRLDWQADGMDRRGDGTYIRLAAQAHCPAASAPVLRYTLLKDQDANHRLLVAGRIAGKDLLTTTSPLQPSLVLGAGITVAGNGTGAGGAVGNTTAPGAQPSSAWAALRDYFSLGMHHLLEGYDHLAFLLALVLPLRLVLFRASAAHGLALATPSGLVVAAQDAQPARAPAGVWLALLRTVTAFTIGHSITLALATFGLTAASPRWVEPAIAASIMVTALLNIRPVPWVRTDVLALLFGLVHGYGFAGLLLEAAAPSGLLPWALAGFNLGVEAGQLIAVAGWVLVSQPLVVRAWYTSVVVRDGSALLVLLAGWWFWQRVS